MGSVTSIFGMLRAKAKAIGLPEYALVLDLNAVQKQNLGIRWGNEILIIRPLTTQDYLEAAEALAQLESLANKKALTADEIIDAYALLFHKICPDITRDMIARLPHQDMIRLRQLCVDVITGKAYVSKPEEKKTPPTETSRSD